MSRHVLALGAATSTELPQAAMQLGAAMRIYGWEGNRAKDVADIFASATMNSAITMEFLQTSFAKAAPIAKQLGMSFRGVTAMLGGLADAGFDASVAGTSTKNILLKLADPMQKLSKAIGKPVNTLEGLMGALDFLKSKKISLAGLLGLSDLRSVPALAVLVNSTEKVREIMRKLSKEESNGVSARMQAQQLDNLSGSVTMLTSAYQGFIIWLGESNDESLKGIRQTVDTATAMFQLAAGVISVNDKVSAQQTRIRKTAATLLKFVKVIWWAIKGFIAFKVLVLGINIVMAAYGAVMGVITAATWAWNAALLANPIGLMIGVIVAAIAVFVGVMYLLISKWDEWGAAAMLVLIPVFGWLMAIIHVFMMFRKNWDGIIEAFQSKGWRAGIEAIGNTLVDAILMPLEQIMEAVNWMTGGALDNALESMAKTRRRFGVSVTAEEVVKKADAPLLGGDALFRTFGYGKTSEQFNAPAPDPVSAEPTINPQANMAQMIANGGVPSDTGTLRGEAAEMILKIENESNQKVSMEEYTPSPLLIELENSIL